MFPYADYDFYVDRAHGKLDQEAFEGYILKASFFLRYITLGKTERVEGEEVSYAACAIADMYAEEKKKITADKKSENNDGYSVTYIAERKDGESMEDFLSRKAMQIARRYLLTTGLLNRKADV